MKTEIDHHLPSAYGKSAPMAVSIPTSGSVSASHHSRELYMNPAVERCEVIRGHHLAKYVQRPRHHATMLSVSRNPLRERQCRV